MIHKADSLTSGQIPWINMGRGFCMVLVYFFHSEICCRGNYEYSYFFIPFFLPFFFFISGYLMLVPGCRINVRHKLRSIFSKLLWPYFVFTSLIWFPKMMMHRVDEGISSYLVEVFGGTASWFVAALIVAELLIICISLVTKKIRLYLFFGVVAFMLALIINKYQPSPRPWYYKSGMMGVLFMSLGGWYRSYQYKLEHLVKWKYCILSFALYFTVMLIDYHNFQYTSFMSIVYYGCVPLGILENLAGICFVLLLVRVAPPLSSIQYIGKYSLSFYFLSGACPFFAEFIFSRMAVGESSLSPLFVTLIALIMAYAITIAINTYCPVMLNLFAKAKAGKV